MFDTQRSNQSERRQARKPVCETARLAVFHQKMISKSLMPFHFPGMFGSNDVLSIHVP